MQRVAVVCGRSDGAACGGSFRGSHFGNASAYSPPRQKVCKVLETKDIRLDFDRSSYAESKSPALAGLGFFSDLSVAAVSRVSIQGFDDSLRISSELPIQSP